MSVRAGPVAAGQEQLAEQVARGQTNTRGYGAVERSSREPLGGVELTHGVAHFADLNAGFAAAFGVGAKQLGRSLESGDGGDEVAASEGGAAEHEGGPRARFDGPGSLGPRQRRVAVPERESQLGAPQPDLGHLGVGARGKDIGEPRPQLTTTGLVFHQGER